MKIRFLGSGTSTGVPEMACHCEVCTSEDQKDKRLRASILIEIEHKNILIDCGPDFRSQILQTSVNHLNGVLITHEHYDHVGGIDDLRPFCKCKAIAIYAEKYVADAIRSRIPYVFADRKYPGIPEITMFEVDTNPFQIEGVEITPIRLLHARLPILGYRIGQMAYLTDLKTIPNEELSKLQGLDVLIVNALRSQEHISHQTTAEALQLITLLAPAKAYLIHMSHHFGLHATMEKEMPENVFISYDGLEIESL